jgi:hypothetical protein
MQDQLATRVPQALVHVNEDADARRVHELDGAEVERHLLVTALNQLSHGVGQLGRRVEIDLAPNG